VRRTTNLLAGDSRGVGFGSASLHTFGRIPIVESSFNNDLVSCGCMTRFRLA
jgi:hypothetical protein